jgi:hypothetical protein
VKRVFVTSVLYTGDLGGLAGADAKCQQRAQAAGLGGTYLAWLADNSQNPNTRFTKSAAAYTRVDGVKIANNFVDLTDGTLLAPINVTELGGPAPIGNTTCAGGGHPTVWTDVLATGNLWFLNGNCAEWTSQAATSTSWGEANMTNTSWSSWCSGGGAVCVWTSALYCFQQ